jgi:hypothetical protein
MDTAGMDEATEMYVVISDMDGGAYGPFFILARALEYAETVDGSVFRLVAAE